MPTDYGLEERFCRDYVCCGLHLSDLHELLQHFEESHVHVESDGEWDDGLPFAFEQDDEFDEMEFESDIYIRTLPPRSNISAFDVSVVRRRPSDKPQKQSHPSHIPMTIPFRFDKPILLEDQMDVDELPPVAAPISTIDRYSTIQHSPPPSSLINNKHDRPYICKIAHCGKAYKNLGGLKYHMKHGHCEDTGDPEMNSIIQKPYVCKIDHCGKRYKNLNGLKVRQQ
jgi:hypothetical protein